MKSVKLKKSLPERKKTTIDISNCSNIENIISDNISQLHLINKLYLDISFGEKHILINEIKSKITGYRQQDIDKQIYNPETLITFEEITEKLLSSKLKCEYCKCNMKLFYKNQREPTQWTLDRINNNIEHSNYNTVTSCLKCNLERRRRNMKDFKFTKQLSIIKK
tara:strand:- start:1522 stop:2016 length:495 start_codon:yes stop_codon:yes gene_type:complete